MGKIAGAVLMLCAFVFVAYAAAPDLLRDTAHSGHWRPTSEWTAENPKCTRHTFVVSNCTVTAVHRFAPSREKRRLTYFTFADWGGQRVAFVQSTKDPGLIALRSAAEGLTGRWALFLVVVGGIAAIAVVGLAKLRSRMAEPAFT